MTTTSTSFLRSTGGRLVTLGMGISLLGGGAAALTDGAVSIALGSAGMLFAITISIVAMAELQREHWFAAILGVIALPQALFLYSMGSNLVIAFHRELAIVLLAAGAVCVAFAAAAGSSALGVEPQRKLAEQH